MCGGCDYWQSVAVEATVSGLRASATLWRTPLRQAAHPSTATIHPHGARTALPTLLALSSDSRTFSDAASLKSRCRLEMVWASARGEGMGDEEGVNGNRVTVAAALRAQAALAQPPSESTNGGADSPPAHHPRVICIACSCLFHAIISSSAAREKPACVVGWRGAGACGVCLHSMHDACTHACVRVCACVRACACMHAMHASIIACIHARIRACPS